MAYLRKILKTRLLVFLAVVGPGFITANVDNDAGGIFTYSQAGAQFGYSLLWTMIPITIALVVVPCFFFFFFFVATRSVWCCFIRSCLHLS